MSKVLINNPDGLIGDFLGTIPVMQEIALLHDGADVIIHPEAEGLFSLIPEDYKLRRVVDTNVKSISYKESGYDGYYNIDCGKAFGVGCQAGLYMTQAHFKYFGLSVPLIPPKAHLKFVYNSYNSNQICDVLVSPFSRSLPEDQKWPREKWMQLFISNPLIKFGVLGNSKHDDPFYFTDTLEDGVQFTLRNVVNIFDAPFDTLCGIFKGTGKLISVVTGTSHLAFHLGVKNILLTSQLMSWGNNPDAIQIKKHVPDITVAEVNDRL